jgi:hypothetical protein
MRIGNIILWEILLLFASVLFFRSIWTLLDKFTRSGDDELWFSLIMGVAVTAICLYKLDKVAFKKDE